MDFVWDVFSRQWEKGFSVLRSYKEQNGDCLVSYNLKFNGFNLGRWVGNQRSTQDRMSRERKQRLDNLGFVWNSLDQQWEEGVAALKSYKEQNGDCLVPTKFKIDGYGLGHWVSSQRKAIDRMSSDKKQQLDDLDFIWDALAYKWEKGFEVLTAFRDKYGHARVAYDYKIDEFALGHWVANQRRGKETMSVERKQRLDALGFVWDAQQAGSI